MLETLSILAIVAESMSGAIAAGRKHMDLFGIVVIAAIAALGGGTVRDILFNTYPLAWVSHPDYLLYSAGGVLLAFAIARHISRLRLLFLLLDAFGLAAFVMLGAVKMHALGMPDLVVVASGMITGICGGVLRDILCNDIPLVLQRELYAMIALGGSVLYVGLAHAGVPHTVNVLIVLGALFTARVLAIVFRLSIPAFDWQGRPGKSC